MLVSLAIATSLLALAEVAWRAEGARPSFVDSKPRWSWLRQRIDDSDDPRRTAIVGSSRILFDLSIASFEQRYPSVPIAQLAVPATGPLATLRSLAHDSDFGGIVLFSFNPENLLPPRDREQQAHVDYYFNRWSLDKRLNLAIGNTLQPILITRQANYGINRLWRSLIADGRPPQPSYVTVDANRVHHADFGVVDGRAIRDARLPNAQRRFRNMAHLVDAHWLQVVASLRSAVNRIRSNGGCVVFIRAPVAGEFEAMEKAAFPREAFWDRIVATLRVPAIHYEDVKAWRGIPLPDDEHMDSEDQRRFTGALLDRLDTMGIYSGNCGYSPQA